MEEIRRRYLADMRKHVGINEEQVARLNVILDDTKRRFDDLHRSEKPLWDDLAGTDRSNQCAVDTCTEYCIRFLARRTCAGFKQKRKRNSNRKSKSAGLCSRTLTLQHHFAARRSAFSVRWRAYFFSKRSTRPAVSTSFCLPVKNG